MIKNKKEIIKKCKIENCRGCAYETVNPDFRVLSRLECWSVMLVLSALIILAVVI